MAFCSSCGTKLEDAAKFCPNCGKSREVSNQAAEPAQSVENPINQEIDAQPVQVEAEPNTPENVNVEYQTTTPDQNTYPQQPQGYAQNPPIQAAPNQYYAPSKPKSSKAPLIITLVVVVILALGIGGFFAVRNIFSGGGKGGAKTQLIAAQNFFKYIDNNEYELFINSIDYEGRFKNFNTDAKSKGKKPEEFTQQLKDMLKELDSQLEGQYGSNWSKKVTYKLEGEPETEGDYKYHVVIATMEGEDSNLDVVSPVKGKGWYVVFDEVYYQMDSFLNE